MGATRKGRTSVDKAKPFSIAKRDVWEAYIRVKANRGAAGVDGESIQDFEKDLSNNLYRIWNRMSSGSYFPPAVRRVDIPKGDGRTRPLGVPTVSDRIAQTVVQRYLERILEPVFHKDSYGYRPGRSAHDALAVARQRCWRYDWVLDLDIRNFFEEIDWELLMRAVRHHTDCAWVLLYVERWLRAPVRMPDGTLVQREKGTPQGSVVSPILANLFLNYVFDRWMQRNFPACPFERYADDALAHCASEEEANQLLSALQRRFAECGLQLHPQKTKIVYCKDANRRANHPDQSFDFLGFTFRPRGAMNRSGKMFVSFSPAVSAKAAKEMRSVLRQWKLAHRGDLGLETLVEWLQPVVRGWVNYYGRFFPSALHQVLRVVDELLVRWARRKYKQYKIRPMGAWHWLQRLKLRQPTLLAHWQLAAPVGR
jgi:group II intron reverse transcriptase/maturase